MNQTHTPNHLLCSATLLVPHTMSHNAFIYSVLISALRGWSHVHITHHSARTQYDNLSLEIQVTHTLQK
jgi:hypothetical protein